MAIASETGNMFDMIHVFAGLFYTLAQSPGVNTLNHRACSCLSTTERERKKIQELANENECKLRYRA